MNQVELDFRANQGGHTQNEKLRDYLQANPNRWIPMPELAQVITPTGIGAAVHSRIADCRKKYGMNIQSNCKRNRSSGLTQSSYFYTPSQSENEVLLPT